MWPFRRKRREADGASAPAPASADAGGSLGPLPARWEWTQSPPIHRMTAQPLPLTISHTFERDLPTRALNDRWDRALVHNVSPIAPSGTIGAAPPTVQRAAAIDLTLRIPP